MDSERQYLIGVCLAAVAVTMLITVAVLTQDRIVRFLFRTLFQVVVAILVAVVVVATLPVTIPASPLLIVGFAGMMRRVRQHRAGSVLAYVEQCVRLNLPLPGMLRAAAAAERGKLRKRLSQLCVELERGVPLAEALEGTVPEIDERNLRMVAAAERIGRLPQVLGRVIEECRRPQNAAISTPGGSFAYSIWLLLLVGFTGMGFMLFTAPKFRKLFEDFGCELPPVTVKLFALGQWFSGTLPGQFMPGALAIFMLMAAALALVLLAHHTRLGNDVRDWMLWHLPLAHATERDRGLADMCSVMSESAEAGMPMHRVLEEAAQLRTNMMLHVRIEHWAGDMAAGATPREGARRAGMPPLIVGMMSSAQTAGNMAETLRFLALYYRSRFSRAALLLKQAVGPVLVLCLGAMVGWAALGMFVPLVQLIHHTLDINTWNLY